MLVNKNSVREERVWRPQKAEVHLVCLASEHKKVGHSEMDHGIYGPNVELGLGDLMGCICFKSSSLGKCNRARNFHAIRFGESIQKNVFFSKKKNQLSTDLTLGG